MNFEQKINSELKEAMKAGKKNRIDVLRAIRAAIIEFNKSGENRELNEDDEIKILKSAAKKHRDAIDMYKNANRPELLAKEEEELTVIEEFLPKQLSEDELKAFLVEKIEDLGVTDVREIGKVIGVAMKELKGKADGKQVQAIVKEYFD